MEHPGLSFALMSVEPLRALMEDHEVIEISINAEDVWVERLGRSPQLTDLRLTDTQVVGMIVNLANISRREVDLHDGNKLAIVSARLPGFRIEAQLSPVAVHGPYVSIRRHNSRVLTLDDYVRDGQLAPHQATYLRHAVQTHQTLLVVGGTSTGKTTFLNALIHEVDRDERLLLIETIPELVVPHRNVVRLEADDEQGYPVHRLLKSALRSRPDRILVGEVRGGEAFDFMDAANTGHPGAMGTVHANSAREGIARLENLVLEGRPAMPLAAIKTRIAQTFNLIVHMERRRIGDRWVRRLGELMQLHGYDIPSQTYQTENILTEQPA
jgi:pilus assembly protein CpaF